MASPGGAEPEPPSPEATAARAAGGGEAPEPVAESEPVLVAQEEDEGEEYDDEDIPVAPGVDSEPVEPPPPPPPMEEEVEPPPPPVEEGDFESLPPPAEEDDFESLPPPAEEDDFEPLPPPPEDDAFGRVEEEVPADPAYSEVEQERIEIDGALKDMTWVGFQQTLEASRVFIKTNEPVRYHVTEEGDELVVIELENTRIPLRNNQRFLDTHFFDSAVTMVTPREIEGVSRNVRIEIQLRNKVPYRTGRDDNMVYLDFQRP